MPSSPSSRACKHAKHASMSSTESRKQAVTPSATSTWAHKHTNKHVKHASTQASQVHDLADSKKINNIFELEKKSFKNGHNKL